MERTTRAKIILIENCSLNYNTRLSVRISLCSAKYLISYTLLNHIYMSPLPSYVGLCLYSLFLPRAEPSANCKAQTRLRLVLPTSLLTFLPIGDFIFPILLFSPMDNTWHARGTRPCPSDPRLQNERYNKLILPKITKMPFIQGGLRVRLVFFQYAEDILGGLWLVGLIGRQS